MATNPMQRKARNSFLLGMLVMLVIAGLVIALLFMQLLQSKKEEAAKLKVYVLNRDVRSGDAIDSSMFTELTVDASTVPSNAIGDVTTLTDVVAKVDLKANAIVTRDLITESDQQLTDDLRKQEYNMLTLPMDLATGDYIDIRIHFPNGQDFIVVSKKKVEIPQIAGVDSSDTIWVNLTEAETLQMSCAIVEAYKVLGTRIYVDKYVEAGLQEAAIPTYTPNRETTVLIESNPNIVEDVRNEIKNRYSPETRNDNITPMVDEAGQEGETNLQTKVEESITNSENARKEFLDSLSTPAVDETTTTN